MKKTSTCLAFFIAFQFVKAQNPVLNPSFENWVDANTPTSWTSSTGNTITKVSPGVNGSTFAAKGKVMTNSPNPFVPTLASLSGGVGFAITPSGHQYMYLQFYYKDSLVAGGGAADRFRAQVIIRNSSGTDIGHFLAADSGYVLTNNYLNFKVKQARIYYSGTPATGEITFTIEPQDGGQYPHVGSWFIVDSVKLSDNPVGINEIEETSKLEIYPNPAHANLNIKTEASRPMQITLSNALGNVVMQRMSSEPMNGYIQESINIESLSSGVYFLTLTSDKKSILRRVLVN